MDEVCRSHRARQLDRKSIHGFDGTRLCPIARALCFVQGDKCQMADSVLRAYGWPGGFLSLQDWTLHFKVFWKVPPDFWNAYGLSRVNSGSLGSQYPGCWMMAPRVAHVCLQTLIVTCVVAGSTRGKRCSFPAKTDNASWSTFGRWCHAGNREDAAEKNCIPSPSAALRRSSTFCVAIITVLDRQNIW